MKVAALCWLFKWAPRHTHPLGTKIRVVNSLCPNISVYKRLFCKPEIYTMNARPQMCFSPHTTSFTVHRSTQWESITDQTCKAVTLLKSSILTSNSHLLPVTLCVHIHMGPI